MFALVASRLINHEFEWDHMFLLVSCSILTATLSCFTLGGYLVCFSFHTSNFIFFLDFVLISVIFLSHRMKLNPDNLATPLAASIGDVVSLLVLSSWAQLLYTIHGRFWKLTPSYSY